MQILITLKNKKSVPETKAGDKFVSVNLMQASENTSSVILS